MINKYYEIHYHYLTFQQIQRTWLPKSYLQKDDEKDEKKVVECAPETGGKYCYSPALVICIKSVITFVLTYF